MVWRNLARIAAAGAEAVGKAFARAVREELNASRESASRQTAAENKAGSAASSSNTTHSQQKAQQRKAMETNTRLGITLQEAIQILDVRQPLNAEEIRQRYDHLFKANEKAKGGTLYLQAKIYRARERLDEELERLEQARREKEEKTTTSSEIEENKNG